MVFHSSESGAAIVCLHQKHQLIYESVWHHDTAKRHTQFTTPQNYYQYLYNTGSPAIHIERGGLWVYTCRPICYKRMCVCVCVIYDIILSPPFSFSLLNHFSLFSREFFSCCLCTDMGGWLRGEGGPGEASVCHRCRPVFTTSNVGNGCRTL